MRNCFKKFVCIVSLFFFASVVSADWNQGDPYKMHFPQMPNPEGWDICLHEQFVADDFQCAETGPIRDIHFWVSWQGDIVDFANTQFTVQIRSNQIPGPCGGGRPGAVLWTWSSTSGIGNMIIRGPMPGPQGWHCPSVQQTIRPDHYNYYQINIENIPDQQAFHQTEGQIYWLVIRANKQDWPPAVGWKTTLDRYMSCSLWSTNGTNWQPVNIPGEGNVDQAFVITDDLPQQEELDFGDAPDTPYPTYLANNGARHKIVPGFFLGASIDPESNGQPTVAADGDDLANIDDEDGVAVVTPLIAGQAATLNITASTPGKLNAWIDFNGDGIWTMAAPEQIAVSMSLSAGVNVLTFTVPSSAVIGNTYARFRFSSAGGLSPTGLAPDGEVEDYQFYIEEPGHSDPNVKYVQLPDLTSAGIDIRVDDGDGVTRHIADDFPCTTTGPITDVHFWGSWRNDQKGNLNGLVIRFYSDDPVGQGGSDPCNAYSKPDQMLWQRTFLPGQFTESLYYTLPMPQYEWWWDPFFGVLLQQGDRNIWQYDIYIDPCDAFIQQGSPEFPLVYWLEIEAWTPYGEPGNQFGWKTSETHWNDDAVFANGSNYPWISGWSELHYPQGHPYWPVSLDMAFKLTTGGKPEQFKWRQQPDLNETGIDIDTTVPFIAADDFNCNQTGLIKEIIVWGSWKNDILPPDGPNSVHFTLSLHKDIPADPCTGAYSRPGNVVWLKHFAPGQFNVKIERSGIFEGWWTPNNPIGYIFPGDTVCWKYTFTIPPEEAFCQEGTPEEPLVYWLDVQAQPIDPLGEARFGWKTSLQHWNDDAVWGEGMEPYMGPWHELIYPPMHQLQGQSIDLAFAIKGGGQCPKADLGDAPDSSNSYSLNMTAYPAAGVSANFPTVFGAGSPPFGPIHKDAKKAFYLGAVVSQEIEADTGLDRDYQNNIIPAADTANLDGADDSVIVPFRMPRCRLIKFDYNITVVDPNLPIYVNVWCDFNRDGDWDDVHFCGTKPADEWAVKDQILTFASAGMYTVSTPPFRVYDDFAINGIDDIWMRITASETPAMSSGSGGSGPASGYLYGETEDYFFKPDLRCWDCGDFNLSQTIDWLDLKELADNWLWTGAGGVMEADLDCDGDIEFKDFAIFAEQWFSNCP